MNRKSGTHPADAFCRDLINRYPKSLEFADTLYRDRNKNKDKYKEVYPDWCALPSSFVTYFLTGSTDEQTMIRILRQEPKHIQTDLPTALLWTRSKMIYRFDDTLADTLAVQPLEGKIPADALNYLPYPCVYIERKMILGEFETIGFFAWLDWMDGEQEKLLRLQFRQANGDSLPLFVPITGGTIDESVSAYVNSAHARSETTGKPKYKERDLLNSQFPKILTECINLLLYLCSEKPDMPDDTELRTRRSRDSYGNPKRAAEWDVGTRIGSALRKAKVVTAEIKEPEDKPLDSSEGTEAKSAHSSPRPHLRRAHWHSFWVGKRDSSERKLVLRWLSPIPVNVDDAELPAVVSPVKGQDIADRNT